MKALRSPVTTGGGDASVYVVEDLMAAFVRHADVEWNGGLMDGNGTAKAGTGAFSLPVTFPSRINEKGDDKTTPEELWRHRTPSATRWCSPTPFTSRAARRARFA
jgi:hypothetical protein